MKMLMASLAQNYQITVSFTSQSKIRSVMYLQVIGTKTQLTSFHNWSQLESTGVNWSQLESTGVNWSQLESTGVDSSDRQVVERAFF